MGAREPGSGESVRLTVYPTRCDRKAFEYGRSEGIPRPGRSDPDDLVHRPFAGVRVRRTGDEEVVLMNDRSGRVIGFEELDLSVAESDSVRVALEAAPV